MQKQKKKITQSPFDSSYYQLVKENCLTLGNDAKLTAKNVTRFVLGTRATTEVFKLYELRYLILKIYPLIHNLFYNSRTNPHVSKKFTSSNKSSKDKFSKTKSFVLEKRKLVSKKTKTNQTKFKQSQREQKEYGSQKARSTTFLTYKNKKLSPQILFASITPKWAAIIKSAAQICQMPFHQNRWLNGSMTAAICYFDDFNRWNYLDEDVIPSFQDNKLSPNEIKTMAKIENPQSEIFYQFQKQFGINKENKEKIKEKAKYYGQSRWPALVVIPDVAQNSMILKETQKVGLPVMGLVNSHCSFEIDYPIFAQDQTPQNVYFFCHFLATLIAKEMVYLQHKRYTLKKLSNKRRVRNYVLQNKILLKKFKPNKKKEKLKQVNGKNTIQDLTKVTKLPRKFVSKFIVPSIKSPFKQLLISYRFKTTRKKITHAEIAKKTHREKKAFFNKKEVHAAKIGRIRAYVSRFRTLLLHHEVIHNNWLEKTSNERKIFNKQLLFLCSFMRKRYQTNYVNSKNNLGRHELFVEQTGKKYLVWRKNFFWNRKDKNKAWKMVIRFLVDSRIKQRQRSKKQYRALHPFRNSSYFWYALQNLNQDLKWVDYHRRKKLILTFDTRSNINQRRNKWLQSKSLFWSRSSPAYKRRKTFPQYLYKRKQLTKWRSFLSKINLFKSIKNFKKEKKFKDLTLPRK